jgi:hypothetical protein
MNPKLFAFAIIVTVICHSAAATFSGKSDRELFFGVIVGDK